MAEAGRRGIFHSDLRFHTGQLGGRKPGVCTMAKQCGHAGVMEFNGDVYSCDHYVFPEYKLGNIRTQTLYGDDVQ